MARKTLRTTKTRTGMRMIDEQFRCDHVHREPALLIGKLHERAVHGIGVLRMIDLQLLSNAACELPACAEMGELRGECMVVIRILFGIDDDVASHRSGKERERLRARGIEAAADALCSCVDTRRHQSQEGDISPLASANGFDGESERDVCTRTLLCRRFGGRYGILRG